MTQHTQFKSPVGEVTVVAFVRAKGGKETRIREATKELQQQVHQKNPGAMVFQSYKRRVPVLEGRNLYRPCKRAKTNTVVRDRSNSQCLRVS